MNENPFSPLKTHKLTRRVMLIVTCLVILMGGAIWIATQVGMAAPQLETQASSIAVNGPVRLVFAAPVDPAVVEAHLRLVPASAGRFEWTESIDGKQSLSFWPQKPFQPGSVLKITLDAGISSLSRGKLFMGKTWQVIVRQAEILYLSPVEKPELWRIAADGSGVLQLTTSARGLYDYNPAPGGNLIAYAARNEQGGLDLWEIRRDGGTPRLLIPCQTDWCSSPAYSPDGRQIAYVRRQATSEVEGPPGNPRIWLLDRQTGSTDYLSIDPNIAGIDPVWSPDGRYLAFVDERAPGIRIVNAAAKTGFLLPANSGLNGSWAPDSRRFLFPDITQAEENPSGGIFVADVATQQVQEVLAEEPNAVEFSAPAWAPDGSWFAVALRTVNGSNSKQIWLIQADGSLRQAVTNDQQITNAAYHWSPAGDQLVFQRLEMGSSDFQPFIAIWSRTDSQAKRLVQNAFQPRWLP